MKPHHWVQHAFAGSSKECRTPCSLPEGKEHSNNKKKSSFFPHYPSVPRPHQTAWVRRLRHRDQDFRVIDRTLQKKLILCQGSINCHAMKYCIRFNKCWWYCHYDRFYSSTVQDNIQPMLDQTNIEKKSTSEKNQTICETWFIVWWLAWSAWLWQVGTCLQNVQSYDAKYHAPADGGQQNRQPGGRHHIAKHLRHQTLTAKLSNCSGRGFFF